MPDGKRPWQSISIEMDHGYFGSLAPMHITCYSNGHLEFEITGRDLLGQRIEELSVNHARCSKKGFAALDQLVHQITELESVLEPGDMMDGPSFFCQVHLQNGLIKGFGYVSQIVSEEVRQIEQQLRRWMREDYFIKENEDVLEKHML